jgi:hypothetical protein
MVDRVSQFCSRFLRRACKQSGFRECGRRMQCDYKRIIWRKRLDLFALEPLGNTSEDSQNLPICRLRTHRPPECASKRFLRSLGARLRHPSMSRWACRTRCLRCCSWHREEVNAGAMKRGSASGSRRRLSRQQPRMESLLIRICRTC